jgi:lipoate-protein ligase A
VTGDNPATFLCFHHHTPGDLILGSAKVVGSAQRKHRGALLQHGAILLAQSEHTPTLPGIAEITGRRLDSTDVVAAVCRELAAALGWRLVEDDWTEGERRTTAELVTERFTHAAWNHKR